MRPHPLAAPPPVFSLNTGFRVYLWRKSNRCVPPREALGRVAALALYHGEALPVRLTAGFWSHVMRLPLEPRRDLRSVDPDLARRVSNPK